jgi:hypothetical protein
MPTLTLSSFNSLLDVVDILTETSGQSSKANSSTRDKTMRLTQWKAALPPKFEYVHSDSTSIPLTPPAVLLQFTHFTTALALSPSQVWLQRILELLDICQGQCGMATLPPVVMCLLEGVKKSSKNLPLDQATQARIDKTISDFRRGQDTALSQNTPNDLIGTYGVYQNSRRGPIQDSPALNTSHSGVAASSQYQQQQTHASSLLNDLLPDMNPNQQLQLPKPLSPHPVDIDFTSPALDAYDPSISGELDNFFDELASLHGAKKLQNQPQFMENLGFAPEVSMADLLATQSGQYMPMHPSALDRDTEGEPLQFPLSDYYNAG